MPPDVGQMVDKVNSLHH